jgi:signal peptidase II
VPKNRYAVFAAIALCGCAIDLTTKSWIFAKLGFPASEPIWLWPGIFSLETSLNEGALFGMGQGWTFVFAALSVCAGVGIVVWLFAFKAARELWLTVALACVMAGILGNLYDRVGMPGLAWPYADKHHARGDHVYAVRDWLHFQCPWFDWPIFNIADSLLVCGAGMLVLQSFRKEAPGDSPAAVKQSPAGA